MSDHTYVPAPKAYTYVEPSDYPGGNRDRLELARERRYTLEEALHVAMAELGGGHRLVSELQSAIERLALEISERQSVPVSYFDCHCDRCR